LRLFSFGGYGLALVVFGAYDSYLPSQRQQQPPRGVIGFGEENENARGRNSKPFRKNVKNEIHWQVTFQTPSDLHPEIKDSVDSI